MIALSFAGPGKPVLQEKPKPALKEPTDAIVRITTTTICGTDLHILKGDVPEVPRGLTLGHEGVGIVDAVGSGVAMVKRGDKVLISCITACGKCDMCRRAMTSQCANGGWILGHRIDGTQAEFVRVPHADTSLYPIRWDVPDEAPLVMLSDVLPTGYECGVLSGAVKPGDVVAIVGAGPIGLSALLSAQFYSPAKIIMIDPDRNRLDVAATLGAHHTVSVNPVEAVLALTEGKGVDVSIEAVGVPESFDVCQAIVA